MLVSSLGACLKHALSSRRSRLYVPAEGLLRTLHAVFPMLLWLNSTEVESAVAAARHLILGDLCPTRRRRLTRYGSAWPIR